jgi:hypothetical protein
MHKRLWPPMFVRNDHIEPDTNTWHHCTDNRRTGKQMTACGLDLRDCLVVVLGPSKYSKPVSVSLLGMDRAARKWCHECFGEKPWNARISP